MRPSRSRSAKLSAPGTPFWHPEIPRTHSSPDRLPAGSWGQWGRAGGVGAWRLGWRGEQAAGVGERLWALWTRNPEGTEQAGVWPAGALWTEPLAVHEDPGAF